MTGPTKLDHLATLATLARSREFADEISPSQMRALRAVADGLVKQLDEHEIMVTADTVMALSLGAVYQATLAAHDDPIAGLLAKARGKDPAISSTLGAVLGLLAADLLDGNLS